MLRYLRVPFSCLPFCILLFACHKDNNPPKPVTPTDSTKTTASVGTMNINLTYPSVYSPTVSFELVISEPGGKVLLDSLAPYGRPIKAALKTNATLVDVTLIDTIYQSLNITVYKSVNPSSWVNTFPAIFLPRHEYKSNTTNASIHYTHVPALIGGDLLTNTFFINGSEMGSYSSGYDYYSQTIDATYQRVANSYNYLLLPQLGVYKLTPSTKDKDTVDLHTMSTPQILTYTKPGGFSFSYFGTKFYGIVDTTNRQLDISFIDELTPHTIPGGDLQFPLESLQAYELAYYTSNASNDQLGFYSYGKSVPSAASFIDVSKIVVQSSQIDNLSVQIGGGASFCRTYWSNSSGLIQMNVYTSPDSAVTRPLTLLTGLKSKFLSTTSFSGVTCSFLDVEQITGFNYAGYFNYSCDPTKVSTHQIRSAGFYYKNL